MEGELHNSPASTSGHERSITACMCTICTKVLRQYGSSCYMTEWPIWRVAPRRCNITCRNRLRILRAGGFVLIVTPGAVTEAEENRLLRMNSWLLSPVGPSMNRTSDQPSCTTLGMDPPRLRFYSLSSGVSALHIMSLTGTQWSCKNPDAYLCIQPNLTGPEALCFFLVLLHLVCLANAT